MPPGLPQQNNNGNVNNNNNNNSTNSNQNQQQSSQLGPIGSSLLNQQSSSNGNSSGSGGVPPGGLMSNLLSSSSSAPFQPHQLSMNPFGLAAAAAAAAFSSPPSTSSLVNQLVDPTSLAALTSQLSQSLLLSDDPLQFNLQLQQQLLLQQQMQQQLQQQHQHQLSQLPLMQAQTSSIVGQVHQQQQQQQILPLPLTPLSSAGSLGAANSTNAAATAALALQFTPPARPSIGTEGKSIKLRANHFTIQIPKGFIYHYVICIQPDKCPKRINRDILATLVQAKPNLFGTQRPVFDGKKNLYTKEFLNNIGNEKVEVEVTLPGEGKDRQFKVRLI